MTRLILLPLLLTLPAFGQTPVATGGTPVYGQPAAGSISGGSCPTGQVATGINSAGVPSCVTAPAATVTSSSLKGLAPALGATTASSINGTASVDQMQTSPTSNDGFANALTSGGQCYGKSCWIESSMTYILEYSPYFLPAIGGNNDQYARFPFQGGYGFPKMSTYKGNATWQMRSINSLPADGLSLYTNRVPFVLENAVSNNLGYATNTGVLALRLRDTGTTHNYIANGATQKGNLFVLNLDGMMRAGQGGGAIGFSLVHNSVGDGMVFAGDSECMGAGESEDEFCKAYRTFYSTSLDRFGGTLNAAPAANPFGYYAMNVTQTAGYKNAKMAATDMQLVNLSHSYAGADATAFQASPYAGFARIALSDISTVASTFGTSTFTTLTTDMTTKTYSGCPSTVTNSANQVPDPAILNENGVGGLVNYCLTVASTSGMSDGMRFSIGGTRGNFEVAKVTHVVDGTHLTANMSMYHDATNVIGFGGAQNWAFNLPGDDIAPNTYSFNDNGPNQTTLHKYFPVLGNDSQYLYVWIHSSAATEFTSTQYVGITPTSGGSLGTPVLSGTSLISIPVASAGNYYIATSGNLSTGQKRLSPPALTIDPSGSACPTTKPTGHVTMGIVANVYQITGVVIDTPGNCSSVPTVSLQTAWHNPYKLAPATVTVKVTDPVTGSATNGYLLTQVLDPTKWLSGDAVEIEAGLHDFTGGNETFAKYLTGGNSSRFGPTTFRIYDGDYASPDALEGIVNSTDPLHYYDDATHPIGPGVAYETPPDGKAHYGALGTVFPLSEPPYNGLFSVGCGDTALNASNNPCIYNNPKPYDLFNPYMNNSGGRSFNHHLRFDPTIAGSEALTWDGVFSAPTITATTSLGGSALAIDTPTSTNTASYFANGLGGTGTQACIPFFTHNFGQPVTTNVHTGAKICWSLDGNYVSHFQIFGSDFLGYSGDHLGIDISEYAGTIPNLTLPSQPSVTCSSSTPGQFNYVAGATGTKDTVEICAKDASNTWAWRVLF